MISSFKVSNDHKAYISIVCMYVHMNACKWAYEYVCIIKYMNLGEKKPIHILDY